MIDWIAPGYLGNITQFKAKYSEPIERGIEEGATRYEKRKSLEKLYVLKRDLAPKIDRKGKRIEAVFSFGGGCHGISLCFANHHYRHICHRGRHAPKD